MGRRITAPAARPCATGSPRRGASAETDMRRYKLEDGIAAAATVRGWPLPGVIMTFLQTGIRLSELANLRVEDVDFDNKVLTVRQGKGKKDRHIPLVDEEVKALRNYLRYRNTQLVLDDEIIFLAKNGTSLNVSTVKYTVAKYVKKAGIRKRVGVHTLRHTFGAHKADKHMGIATLQEVMGHKKKETTLKYIHLAKTNLRQEMSQTAL